VGYYGQDLEESMQDDLRSELEEKGYFIEEINHQRVVFSWLVDVEE
jgi:hypothetical protein